MAGLAQKGLKNILQKGANDVVILSSVRTPVTRAKKGGLKNAYPEELLAAVLKATLVRNPSLDPKLIQDVCIGSVLQELGGAKAGRMALNHVGYPSSISFSTMNRQCSSGLAAITFIAHSISVGQIDIGVGGGMESMTRNYESRAIPTALWPDLRESPVKDARDCIMPMGLTSENVASRYGITREDQDAFAASSHQKAAAAQAAGLFDGEIIPVSTLSTDPENPSAPPKPIIVEKDDGIRPQTTLASLAKLKPAFLETGSSTAGNSSQISDGATATLLCRRSTAHALGIRDSIMGKWVFTQAKGCAPDEMGIGPALAIPAVLDATGLKVEDVDVWEVNEAFASQALYCVRKLELDEEKVNPRGGAIALGHPLGATGARMVATLLGEMKEGEMGVVSMCVGTGMGVAGVFVRE